MLNSNHGIWLCSLVSRLQYVIGHYGRNHTKIIQHRLKSFEATTWWFIYLMNGMNPHLTNKGSSPSPGAYFKTGIHNISLKYSRPPSRAPRLLVAEWYQSLMALSSSFPFNRYRKEGSSSFLASLLRQGVQIIPPFHFFIVWNYGINLRLILTIVGQIQQQ